jgi:MSHA pilin protein MshA
MSLEKQMNKNVKNAQSGFTLIELVVVIVILGILAATAMPKFVDMGTEARTASLNGLAGAIKSTVAMQYAKTAATGTASYPTAATVASQTDFSGFTEASGVYTLQTGCTVTYTEATGAVAVDSSGC